ncbi:MAG: hypothetical protein KKC46_10315 [Proteobacteria bacterium]|nr:hypothetical protein [Pseudomonadota bacterium]
MKPFILIIACIVIQILCVTSGFSHGTLGHVARSDGYLVTAEYDDGEPMSYAAVEIRSADSDIAFQTGRCDRNGHFMFFPDKQGQWDIVVTDGMGHRIALISDISIDANNDDKPKTSETKSQAASYGITRAEKIVMGLSIIFGIFGLWYGWKAKREIRQKAS